MFLGCRRPCLTVCLSILCRDSVKPAAEVVFADTHKEYHSWGKMRNVTDIIVIVIKFHPICDLAEPRCMPRAL